MHFISLVRMTYVNIHNLPNGSTTFKEEIELILLIQEATSIGSGPWESVALRPSFPWKTKTNKTWNQNSFIKMKMLVWEEAKKPEKLFVKIIVRKSRKSFLKPKLTQPNPLPPLSRFFHPLIFPGPPNRFGCRW